MRLSVRVPVPYVGWQIQVPALQEARRRLLTRCSWCGGRSKKGHVLNVGTWGGGEPRPWWRGRDGVTSMGCSTVQAAHRTCACDEPRPYGDGYRAWALQDLGMPVEVQRAMPRAEDCRGCGRRVPFRTAEDEAGSPGVSPGPERRRKYRVLQTLPPGSRIPAGGWDAL